jgi:ATP-dependent DNA helicase PIF1
MQLPPVGRQFRFCFETNAWASAVEAVVVLKQVFRQQGDPRLVQLLSEARVGRLSSQSVQILQV